MTALSISCVTFIVCLPAGSLGAQSSSVTRASAQPSIREAPSLEKVTGIGGFFFRAADPKALSEWYERHLGVSRTPETYEQEPWQQDAGPTAFAPFRKDTKYFGADKNQWMINFRVRDLAAMVAQLNRAGIEVEVDPKLYPNGRFAGLEDPEGNPIQLWEPRRPGQAR